MISLANELHNSLEERGIRSADDGYLAEPGPVGLGLHFGHEEVLLLAAHQRAGVLVLEAAQAAVS